jgi:hypothetical protein
MIEAIKVKPRVCSSGLRANSGGYELAASATWGANLGLTRGRGPESIVK